MMPVTFTAQYHFTNLGAWKPYVGGGFNYTYFYETDLGNNAGASVNRDSWGGALQAGVDYQIPAKLVHQLRRQVPLDKQRRPLEQRQFREHQLARYHPWLFGVGVRYRF